MVTKIDQNGVWYLFKLTNDLLKNEIRIKNGIVVLIDYRLYVRKLRPRGCHTLGIRELGELVRITIFIHDMAAHDIQKNRL